MFVPSARDSNHNIHSVIYWWNPQTEVRRLKFPSSASFCQLLPDFLGSHLLSVVWGEPDPVHLRGIWLGVLLSWSLSLPGSGEHVQWSDHHHQLHHLRLAGWRLPAFPGYPSQSFMAFSPWPFHKNGSWASFKWGYLSNLSLCMSTRALWT